MRLVFFFLISQIYGLPEPPNHSFEKKISISKKTVSDETGQHEIEIKKVFVKFIQGCYTFKKRREKAGCICLALESCGWWSWAWQLCSGHWYPSWPQWSPLWCIWYWGHGQEFSTWTWKWGEEGPHSAISNSLSRCPVNILKYVFTFITSWSSLTWAFK